MRRTHTSFPSTLPTTFEDLCRLHWPRPIHDAADYTNTAEVVDRLALLSRRTEDQNDYLEALSTLLEKYDRELLSEEGAEGGQAIATLKYLMEGRRMSASDLGRILGNRTLGPAILRGARKISRANAAALGEHFKVDAALFFQP
jgi:HTH-type transcriptional regulator / antitoxin HigA